MSAPSPYVTFPGTTREALSAYQRIFGGELSLHTRGDLQRTVEAEVQKVYTSQVRVYAVLLSTQRIGVFVTGCPDDQADAVKAAVAGDVPVSVDTLAATEPDRGGRFWSRDLLRSEGTYQLRPAAG